MSTQVYLTNIPSEVSGYYVALIGMRSPYASSTVSTAVTGLTAGGTSIQMTLTSGGTALAFITAPFEANTTITNVVSGNLWAKEGATTDNAQVGFQLYEYTTSEQSVFCASSRGAELTASIALQGWGQRSSTDETNGNYTATTIDAGNRLVIKPWVYNVGTMAAANAVTMDYNGLTPGADGDSFIQFTESFEANDVQIGTGTTQQIQGGPQNATLQGLVDQMDAIVTPALGGPSATWAAIKNEMTHLEDAGTA